MSTGIGGVLFDKDGTLIDFRATWLPAYEAIVRDLFGADPRAQLNQDLGRLKALLESEARSETHGQEPGA